MRNQTISITNRTWVRVRRVVQLLFLALFVWLFLKAEFGGQNHLAWPVDLFFRFDPLILAAHLLSFSPLVAGLFWSLLFVALTFLLGRFFCGWICPLGTTLDCARRLLFAPRTDRGVAARWRRGKYYLLIGLLVGALFSLNLAGLFDPLSLLYRSLAIVFYPAFGYAVYKGGLTLYHLGPPITYISEPLYQFFKATLLPFRPLVYVLPFLTLVLFALVVAAERIDRRFWCRAFCPLGALYGFIARFSLLRRRPAALCPDCGDCTETCKMAAFALGEPSPHQHAECQLCLRCLEACDKEGRVSFSWASKAPRAPLDLGRRQVITAVATGAVALPLVRLRSLALKPDEFLIRPPGAQSEAELLSRCIRCALGSRAGGPLYPAAHLPPGLLLLFLQPLRPGLPHRRHPQPEAENQTDHRPGDGVFQPLPVHSLVRGHRLSGVRGALPRLTQGHHFQGAGDGQCTRRTGEDQAAPG
jgi:polyferredoxin